MPSVRSTTEAMVGYFTIRQARGAASVPARIFDACRCTVGGTDESLIHDWTPACDRSPTLIGIICGEVVTAEKVWLSGSLKMISQKEYELLMSQMAWDRAYDPTAPLANGDKPVDFLTIRLPF